MNYAIFVAFALAGLCTYGVDYSTLFKTSQIACLKQADKAFAVPRGYCSYGALDPNIKENLANAWAGGMTHVDLYMFPCFSCNNPAEQAKALVSGLSGHKYGMIWIDIEIYKWSTNFNENRNFILELIKQLVTEKASIGIYTNYHNWVNIVGLDWQEIKAYPLWYAHYDNNPSFSDFTSFGGWTKPSIKQYKGTTTLCEGGVDLSFY
jgi:GH25 family lysozyme M1 (1,4-beta-N-acetylmuramidase)